MLGKCIEKTTSKFVSNIDPASLEKSEIEKLEGEVVKVLGNKLVINIGKNQGISKKQQGEISREIEVEELADKVSMPIGKIEVISLEHNAAIVRVTETEESESPKKGDMVSFELR